jgi:hypothetical protein
MTRPPGCSGSPDLSISRSAVNKPKLTERDHILRDGI